MAFAPGDVVTLKSGGHSMTVVSISDEDIDCLWVSDDGELFRQSIPAIALTVVELAEIDEEDEAEEEDDDEDEEETDEEEADEAKRSKTRMKSAAKSAAPGNAEVPDDRGRSADFRSAPATAASEDEAQATVPFGPAGVVTAARQARCVSPQNNPRLQYRPFRSGGDNARP